MLKGIGSIMASSITVVDETNEGSLTGRCMLERRRDQLSECTPTAHQRDGIALKLPVVTPTATIPVHGFLLLYHSPARKIEETSRLIAARVRAKPDLVVGLATGLTMERVYDRLVAKHQKEGLDFSRCRTFNLDEYIGIPAED